MGTDRDGPMGGVCPHWDSKLYFTLDYCRQNNNFSTWPPPKKEGPSGKKFWRCPCILPSYSNSVIKFLSNLVSGLEPSLHKTHDLRIIYTNKLIKFVQLYGSSSSKSKICYNFIMQNEYAHFNFLNVMAIKDYTFPNWFSYHVFPSSFTPKAYVVRKGHCPASRGPKNWIKRQWMYTREESNEFFFFTGGKNRLQWADIIEKRGRKT